MHSKFMQKNKTVGLVQNVEVDFVSSGTEYL